MSDEPVKQVRENPEKAVTADTPRDEKAAEISLKRTSEEKLVRKSKDKESFREGDELLRSSQFASAYAQTNFTGQVSGPVHAGSGRFLA